VKIYVASSGCAQEKGGKKMEKGHETQFYHQNWWKN